MATTSKRATAGTAAGGRVPVLFRPASRLTKHLLLIVFGLFMLYPLLWMMLLSSLASVSASIYIAYAARHADEA